MAERARLGADCCTKGENKVGMDAESPSSGRAEGAVSDMLPRLVLLLRRRRVEPRRERGAFWRTLARDAIVERLTGRRETDAPDDPRRDLRPPTLGSRSLETLPRRVPLRRRRRGRCCCICGT